MLSWLNPVGLLNHNPTGLIAKMNNTELETADLEMMDMEKENIGKGNNFQTTFKQGVGVIKLFAIKLQRLLQYHWFASL